MRPRRALAAVLALAVLAGPACSGTDDTGEPRVVDRGTTTTAGEIVDPLPTGLDDPLYPDLGAPGMDVQHYDVDLAVDAGLLASGTVTLTIEATEALSQVAVDARTIDIEEVTLDGDAVDFAHESPELLVTPAEPIAAGTAFDLAVTYRDDPAPHPDVDPLGTGWVVDGDYSYTLNEPEATRDWLPSLDHPSDKATWRFSITPPPGTIAIANGEQVSAPADGEEGPWVWEVTDPMATYLAQVLVGDWVLVDGNGPGGVRLSSALLRDRQADHAPLVAGIGDQLAFFASQFGPYPFPSYGVAVIDDEIGLALEQQGRSLLSSDAAIDVIAAHELAHQWFGDAVTPERWGDIWLSESFATYGEWLWSADRGRRTVDGAAAEALAQRRDEGGPPTARPTRAELFGFNVYEGGAVVVHALRRELGDGDFFALLRRWVAEGAGTSRRTEDFTALASEVAERDLTDFFTTWLEADDLPADYPS